MPGQNSEGLYGIFYRKLANIEHRANVIRFPEIFENLCRAFAIKKEKCWEILFILRDVGWIEIIPFHEIKLMRKLEDE